MKNVPTGRGLGLVFASLLLSSIGQTAMASKRVLPQRKTVPTYVAFCDLVSNPAKYNSKEITTRASYRYGFEWQELFCLPCGEKLVWLEFSEDLNEKSKAALRKAPKDHGIINAVFSGTFRSSGGPYGHGAYKFELEVKDVKSVEVISKDIRHPNLLPEKVRRRMCVSDSRSRTSTTASKHLAISRSKTSDP